MHIDRLGIAHIGVTYIPDGTIVESCFKVRVLSRKGEKYIVVGEEYYLKFPTDDEIMWCIATFKGSQAVIEKVYWLEKIPFTEDEDNDVHIPPIKDIDDRRVFITYNESTSEVIDFKDLATKVEDAICKGDKVTAERYTPDWEGNSC